jgi:peptidoglycan hydrolase FlgJ
MPTPISLTQPLPSLDSAEPGRRAAGASRSASPTPDDPKLKTACDEMESLFIQHMLTEMRKTVTKSGLIDGGRAEEIYTSMMDAEVAKQMAASGGLGLARMLQEQVRARTAAAETPDPEAASIPPAKVIETDRR